MQILKPSREAFICKSIARKERNHPQKNSKNVTYQGRYMRDKRSSAASNMYSEFVFKCGKKT